MAVQSVSHNSQSSSSSSWSHSAPSGLTAGDLVVAIIRLDTTSDLLSSISKDNVDATWVEVGNDSTYRRTYVWVSRIGPGGSPPSSYTITLSSAATGTSSFFRVQGVVSASDVEISNVGTGTSATPSSGIFSALPGTENYDVLNFVAYGGSSNTVSVYPSGYGSNENDTGPSGEQSAICTIDDQATPPGGASDDWTLTNSAEWKSFRVALRRSGYLAVEESPDTSSASGTVSTTITGSGSPTESPDDPSASGDVTGNITGSGSPVESADSSTASGDAYTAITGSGSPTEAVDTSSASGSVSGNVTGSGSPTETADTSTASGSVSGNVSGSGSPTEAADTSTASGSAFTAITGSGSPTEASDTSSGMGHVSGGTTIIGAADITEASDTPSSPARVRPASRGMTLMDCCCDCLIFEDDFTGTNGDPPNTTNWYQVSGEHQIENNQLKCITDGLLITQYQQDTNGPDSAELAVWFAFDIVGPNTVDHIVICRYASPSDYDYVKFVYDSGAGVWYPEFYAGGVLVMDITTHPAGSGMGDSSGITGLQIAYSNYEWTVEWQGGGGSAVLWTYCEGDPETSFPAGLGVIGFGGEADAEFDNFSYYKHWETDEDNCPKLACFCIDPSSTDRKCMPETLTLRLTPTINQPTCSPTGTTLEFTLTQSLNSSTLSLSPFKFSWRSPLIDLSSGPAPTPVDGHFILFCDDNDSFELVFLEWGSDVTTYDPILAQFVTLDGARGGATATDIQCLPTIRLEFPDFDKVMEQDTGSPGPYWCTTLDSSYYTVEVVE